MEGRRMTKRGVNNMIVHSSMTDEEKEIKEHMGGEKKKKRSKKRNNELSLIIVSGCAWGGRTRREAKES